MNYVFLAQELPPFKYPDAGTKRRERGKKAENQWSFSLPFLDSCRGPRVCNTPAVPVSACIASEKKKCFGFQFSENRLIFEIESRNKQAHRQTSRSISRPPKKKTPCRIPSMMLLTVLYLPIVYANYNSTSNRRPLNLETPRFHTLTSTIHTSAMTLHHEVIY